MGQLEDVLSESLQDIQRQGLWKKEHFIEGQQSDHVMVESRDFMNLCANNYLGFAAHPEVMKAAKDALERFGFGVASVRFVCGTQTIHKALEKKLADFFEMDDAILYSSCFDANTGLFETLFQSQDAIVSDSLNHASLIDGIRLCKAHRLRYKHADLQDLEDKLKSSMDKRLRVIVTDGVFSMDGEIAPLAEICQLAEKYNANVVVDDSHAAGFMGEKGRGSIEACGVMGKIDILTGTLGKALGGASGGYVCGSREVIDTLRQKSRPYLFSNSVPPYVVGASLKALDLVQNNKILRTDLHRKTMLFRSLLEGAGFQLGGEVHPIVPVMIGSAHQAQQMAEELYERGYYVVAFSYPVVPKDQARIRTQISAVHSDDDLKKAANDFIEIGRKLEVLI
ncbi:MAG: glycine C-acetyltransferase [Oligoflexales bacterium]